MQRNTLSFLKTCGNSLPGHCSATSLSFECERVSGWGAAWKLDRAQGTDTFAIKITDLSPLTQLLLLEFHERLYIYITHATVLGTATRPNLTCNYMTMQQCYSEIGRNFNIASSHNTCYSCWKFTDKTWSLSLYV